jgi:hypothetical protein
MPSKHPWELVSSSTYFRRILGNFEKLGFGPKKDGQAHVQFGETGNGHSPHYQITDDTGNIACFNGRNHKRDKSVGQAFADANLFERLFCYSEVQALLANCKRP